MSDQRIALQNNSVIWLNSATENINTEKFIINKVINKGGSVICYNAAKNGQSGTLKEFYPIDSDTVSNFYFNLDRKNSPDSKLMGQLYSKNSTFDNFIFVRENYRTALEMVKEAKEKRIDLKLFLPSISVYKSKVDENDNNFTYYTWTPDDPDMMSFDEFLKKVCSDTQNRKNELSNILLILNCILELCKGIYLLHRSALYHLDLTPQNFGVKKYCGSANKNISISLYDTNTIYSIGKTQDFYYCGTPCFRSPDMANGFLSRSIIKHDIYSIGTIIYYSFVVLADKDGHYYNEKYLGGEKNNPDKYELIQEKLKSSKLIKSNDETENTIFFRLLLNVIKKSLNWSDTSKEKYNELPELINDVEKLINIFSLNIGKEEIEKSGSYFLKTVFETKEEHYNETVKTGATGAIQWLLYKHPLYDYKINNNTDLNVLVLGCGTYSPKFIDTALELSQIEGLHLNLTVASEEPHTDKGFYLNNRPEFCGFFSVDGDRECKRAIHPYGDIEFKKAHFDISVSNPDVEKLLQEKAYSYVFIALNDENLNEKVAKQCSAYLENKKNRAIVSYVIYGKSDHLECTNNYVKVVPVCVTDVLSEQDEYKYLEQMAFNAHLLWSPCNISALEEAEKTFYNDEYNYNSSLKNALSLKYKLHSIGVNLKSENPSETAAGFKQKYADKKDLLIMYEQKRWNVGQITDGWKVMERSEYSTLKTATKNKDEKKHPVICDACEPEKKNTLEKWEKSKWDNATAVEISDLDPLNKMSVYMHRHFTELSKNIGRKRNIIKGQFGLLSKIVHKNARLINLLTFLCNTVDKMLNDNLKSSGLVKSYSHYKNAFEAVLKTCCNDNIDIKKADECLKNIDKDLFPLIQSLSYKNWKNNNFDLIENIPFILTHSKNIHICIPMILCDENHNCALFFNVASAIKIRPSKVTYIVDGDFIVNDENRLFRTLDFINRMFTAHKVQTKTDLVILKNRYISNNFLNRDLIKKRFAFVNKIDYIDQNVSDKQAVLMSYLRDNQSAENIENKFTALEYPCTEESDLYAFVKNANKDSSDDVSIVPAFYFDEKSQTFTAYDSDFEWLNYIPFKQNLHINELFDEDNIAFSEPELSHCVDYIDNILANEYDIWCKLCDMINSKVKCNQKLTEFKMGDSDDDYKSNCEFVFPSYCENAVDKIVDKLKYHNIISDELDIIRLNSKISLLRIENLPEKYKIAFERLFGHYTRLRDESSIFVKKMNNDIIVCSDDNLDICNLCISERFNISEKQCCVNLLHGLSKEHIIFNLKIESTDGNTIVSFKFPSVYEKQLMNNSNKIVQAVLYYKLLESELFDDVQSDVVLSLGNNMSVTADAIATKGFRTFIFITKPISYDAFAAVKEKFLINGTIIMVNRNGEKNDRTTEEVCTLSLNDEFQSELSCLIDKI